MTTVRRIGEVVAAGVPSLVERLGRRGYDRWRTFRADRSFPRYGTPGLDADPPDEDHVVLVTVDALRADAVDEAVAPYLAGLPGLDAVAPAPWTYPSVASLVTGRYPHEHGAMRQHDDVALGGEEGALPPALSEDEATLPELMAGLGYETLGAFGFTVPFLALEGRFATHRLFDRAPATDVLDAYRSWRRDVGDRSFAYLHLFDLHGPFHDTPPERYWAAHDVDDSIPGITSWRFTDEWEGDEVERYITHRKRLYRAALDYVDDQLQRFAAEHPDTTVLVTGDHGEAFWEHAAFDAARFEDPRPAYSVGHGGTPYEAIARVPLLGEPVADADGPTSLIDVAPTLLDGVGVDPLESMSGRVLDGDVEAGRKLLIESTAFGHEKKAAYLDGWKLLASRRDSQEICFDIADEEPSEPPENVVAELREVLPDWPDGGGGRKVGAEVERRLQRLGYK